MPGTEGIPGPGILNLSPVLPVPKLSLVCTLVRLTGIEDSQDLRNPEFRTNAKLRHWGKLEVSLRNACKKKKNM